MCSSQGSNGSSDRERIELARQDQALEHNRKIEVRALELESERYRRDIIRTISGAIVIIALFAIIIGIIRSNNEASRTVIKKGDVEISIPNDSSSNALREILKSIDIPEK